MKFQVQVYGSKPSKYVGIPHQFCPFAFADATRLSFLFARNMSTLLRWNQQSEHDKKR